MAIFQGDVFFRRVLELIIQDIRQNPWLIDDALSDFVNDPALSGVYGQKEIENAKKWFKDNDISIFLKHRMDLEKMPCLTLSIGSNIEDRSLSRLADQTPFYEDYTPFEVGKTIGYIVKPFEYDSYDSVTGKFTVLTEDISLVQPGMVAIDPDSGVGYAITSKDSNGFFVAEGSEFNGEKVGILPQYRIFRAKREMATFQERITIGCHVHGDPNALLWLYTIMMYGFLRYREGLLESRGFQLSNLETSDMIRNENFESFGENVYSRFIIVSGQVENTWVKSPKRFIEAVRLGCYDDNGDQIRPGLIIINEKGGEVPEIIDETEETWVAKDSEN
jgi:hypothetical protein